MLDGYYAGRFQIGIGSDASNMEGIWTVTTKETNPAYQGSNQSLAGGDPTNPLGDRMLVLYPHSDNHQVAPIGIHGSTATSGLDDPRGFIRLSAADVADEQSEVWDCGVRKSHKKQDGFFRRGGTP